MNDTTREKLIVLRSDIAAESVSLAAALPAVRQSIADAEAALATAKSAEREVREVIAAGVANEPISNRLSAFLRDAEIDNAVAAAPTRARHELARIEAEVADCADAIRQVDRCLNGTWPTGLLGREPPVIVKREKPQPVEFDPIVMPGAAA